MTKEDYYDRTKDEYIKMGYKLKEGTDEENK